MHFQIAMALIATMNGSHLAQSPAATPTLAPGTVLRRATLLVHDLDGHVLEINQRSAVKDLGNGLFDVDPKGLASSFLAFLSA